MTTPAETSSAQLCRAGVSLWIGLGALVLLIGVLGIWSVTARIAGAVIVQGMIEVENNRQVIQHPQGGVVGDLLVRNGDLVQAGQVVVRLDDSLLRSELGIVVHQLSELRARKGRLQAEQDGAKEITFEARLLRQANNDPEIADLVDGQQRLFHARATSLKQEKHQLDQQIVQTQDQILGAQAQRDALTAQSALIAEELADARILLAKGLTQASRVSSLRREEARLLGQSAKTVSDIARLKIDIARLQVEKLRIAAARREDAITVLRDIQVQELELTARALATRDALSKMEVRAPVSGVVYDSRVFALQSVVTAAEPIMFVVPQDQPLVVSARIDAIHIDQVYEGQPATLRFVAFDQRTTPEILGTITNLSADAFTDDVTGLSYYQAQVLPKDGELTKLGDQALLPGMPVETFIKTAERSPLSYLVKPLMDYFNKAFREA